LPLIDFFAIEYTRGEPRPPIPMEELIDGSLGLTPRCMDLSKIFGGGHVLDAPYAEARLVLTSKRLFGHTCEEKMMQMKSIMEPQIREFRSSDEYFFREGCHIIELSNQNSDPVLSIAQARLAPGVTTKWHSLSQTVERYVILEGEGRVEVGDLAPQRVSPGDVAIIPPDCRQRIANTGAMDLIFLALCTPRFIPENYQELE